MPDGTDHGGHDLARPGDGAHQGECRVVHGKDDGNRVLAMPADGAHRGDACGVVDSTAEGGRGSGTGLAGVAGGAGGAGGGMQDSRTRICCLTISMWLLWALLGLIFALHWLLIAGLCRSRGQTSAMFSALVHVACSIVYKTHTGICIYKYMYIYISICIYIYIPIYIHVNTCTYVYVYAYMQICIYVYISRCICKHVIHIHMCICICTDTRAQLCFQQP